MKDQDIKSQALKLARRYSLQAENNLPNNEAAQALSQLERTDIESQRRKERENLEWQQFLRFEKPEIDDDTAPLKKVCKNLVQTWTEFERCLPQSNKGLPATRGPPNFITIRAAVDETVREWESKREKGFGRVRAGFYQFCGVLDVHSELFSFFPKGDKYTSLFSGVISSIVKASTRHEKIAEGFARAISEISTNLDQSLRQCTIYRTPKMKDFMMTMCIKYLNFLSHTMKWYQSKWERFKSSVSQDYTNEVEAKIIEVKELVNKIVLEAGMESQKVGIEAHEVGIKSQKDISEIKTMVLEILRQAIGLRSQSTLAATGERLIYDAALDDAERKALPAITESDNYEGGQADLEESLPYGRVEMEFDTTAVLNKYVGDLKPLPPAYNTTKQVSGEIIIRLQSWLSSTKSQTLWIMGLSSNASACSEATLAAIHVSSLCHLSGITCVSFFCRLVPRPGSHVPQVVALLYSLIRQLTAFAPSSLPPSSSLRSKVAQLNGTEASIPQALSIISDLIGVSSGLILVVIDGLQYLDHTSTKAYIESLLDTLQHAEKTEKVVKLLLTTDGFFDGGKLVKVDDRLDCRVLPKKRGPGPLIGGKSLHSVSMPTLN